MEPLKDPLKDRVVTQVHPPPHRPLSIDYLVKPFCHLPCWRFLKDHLAQEGTLTKSSAIYLISQAKFLFQAEKNILEIKDPVVVVGDLHGQFYDLLRILEVGGDPEKTKYLFLGDYVDRGHFSLEIIMLLYALKINYPNTFYLIRGNHETRQMTTHFKFRQEVLHKHDLETYELIMESFDALPIACIVNGKFLSVHGGISSSLFHLSDIMNLNRFIEPPNNGLFCDLLWSDPVDNPSGVLSECFMPNITRSCSVVYGFRAVNIFLKENSLVSIIRAHEAQMEGFKMHKWNGPNKFPTVLTIFSAPDYCGTYNNKGAILRLEDSTLSIHQICKSPEPYCLPHQLDVFAWSVPFVIEKCVSMFNHIFSLSNANKDQFTEDNELIEEMLKEMQGQRKVELAGKIKTLSRMITMIESLNEKNNINDYPKSYNKDYNIPDAIVGKGLFELETKMETFEKVKAQDMVNEKCPTA
ncbi:hypothetical protein SteCoe_24923 [Stentor coeruleus]|uniref:Serine/threonine-protein phosphatase n=1 Tax=Stentor coeruleus TaxID=5963 RepID=A0A1R2BGJ7_9CILI|nr:hypothetical protein SteCoe_24923 [Stentor coeruleus]